MDEVQAIYTIWLREMIRTIRSKTRILASFSMPIFFLVIFGTGLNRSFSLTGALFPIDRLPEWLKILVYIDPLTYGVDALRQSMIGVSVLPFWLDITVMGVFCTFTILAGTFFFGRMR